MPHRIEIISKFKDERTEIRLKKIHSLGNLEVKNIFIVDVYTIDKNFSFENLETFASLLSNPVTQTFFIDKPFFPNEFSWAVEIGFLSGVTDNVGNTAKEILIDKLSANEYNNNLSVYTSTLTFIEEKISLEKVQKIADNFSNHLINSIRIKNKSSYFQTNGMGIFIPKVELKPNSNADEVNLNVRDGELLKIGKFGILENQNQENEFRRGSLALELDYLKTIQNYFASQKRNPKDVEIESLAQTWSEHCKHTIFAAQIDEIENGIFKTYIKKATDDIRKLKGENDICISIFHDNAGGIIFDENFVVTDKVETHNTPSALDPFGGSVTGILGVNRDTIGFGKGAKPILNRYGFCFGFPNDESQLFRDKEKNYPLLFPKKILEGVVEGVNVGGNCSGIPTPQGFLFFDNRYKGKPLVFVGTIGLIPKTLNHESKSISLIEKKAQVGDYIVTIGGKVGQDGIHGATFSSETLSETSPSTAVQIGDAITQKKMSDAIIKDARNLNLYNSITDNGAGGLSCSVAEMARECGGAFVELEKVPTKYPNLPPWKIWISESQERMTLSVPKEKWNQFSELMKKHEVEATIIGEFTNSEKCVVSFYGKEVMNIDLEFLHNGLPKKNLKTESQKISKIKSFADLYFENSSFSHQEKLLHLLSHPNICSTQFVSEQYDHTVQGTSIISPLIGKGKVNGNTSVIRPILSSWKGVSVSQSLFPHLTEINPYLTSGITIDKSIGNLIAIGTPLNHIALLDNFCWCDALNPKRLWQLKETALGCYDFAVQYQTPFISGKDSMFNDFRGYDEFGNEINISVLPTLLISSIGVITDIRKCVTMDFKFEDDEIFLVGKNFLETKNSTPSFKTIQEAIELEILSSSYSIQIGGIAVGLAKISIAGSLGIEVNLDEKILFDDFETQFIVSVEKKHSKKFEEICNKHNSNFKKIGKVVPEKKFTIKNFENKTLIESNLLELENYYKKPFESF